MRAVLHESEKVRRRLTAMVAEDIAAFDSIMAAYKLPKSDGRRQGSARRRDPGRPAPRHRSAPGLRARLRRSHRVGAPRQRTGLSERHQRRRRRRAGGVHGAAQRRAECLHQCARPQGSCFRRTGDRRVGSAGRAFARPRARRCTRSCATNWAERPGRSAMPGGRIDTDRAFTALCIAVLTISDSRDAGERHFGRPARGAHRRGRTSVAGSRTVRDDKAGIQRQVRAWIEDPGIDVIITNGGTGLTAAMWRRKRCASCSTGSSKDSPRCGTSFPMRRSAFPPCSPGLRRHRRQYGDLCSARLQRRLPGRMG